jgi:hypothetical protein
MGTDSVLRMPDSAERRCERIAGIGGMASLPEGRQVALAPAARCAAGAVGRIGAPNCSVRFVLTGFALHRETLQCIRSAGSSFTADGCGSLTDGTKITGNRSRHWVAQDRDKSWADVVNAARSATILNNFRRELR